MLGTLTQEDRVDIAITPEFVEHGIVREAGKTIEDERVEFVSTLDVVAEGLKHISQLCAITEEVDEETSCTVLTLSFAKSTGLFSGMVSTGQRSLS